VTDNNVKIKLNNSMSESVHVVTRVVRSVVLLEDKAAKERELTKITKARADYDKAWEELQKFPASEAGMAIRTRRRHRRRYARAAEPQGPRARPGRQTRGGHRAPAR
jgi:methyl-accepting chemotaxis protein